MDDPDADATDDPESARGAADDRREREEPDRAGSEAGDDVGPEADDRRFESGDDAEPGAGDEAGSDAVGEGEPEATGPAEHGSVDDRRPGEDRDPSRRVGDGRRAASDDGGRRPGTSAAGGEATIAEDGRASAEDDRPVAKDDRPVSEDGRTDAGDEPVAAGSEPASAEGGATDAGGEPADAGAEARDGEGDAADAERGRGRAAGATPTPGVPDADRSVPEDVRKYERFKKMDGAQYDRVNEFLRDRTYVTAREWAIARLCSDFRTETGVEMTKIGENLPELVPFMTDTYTPQAVNQARSSFDEKVRKAGATFLYGAMCDFYTAEELDDVMYEVTEVAKFLLEVEGVDLSVDEELAGEERISSVMREVREASRELREREAEEAEETAE